MNWNSHAPIQWEIGTFKNLVKGSFLICSEQHLLQKENEYLTKVFLKITNYSSKSIENIISNELQK